MVPETSRFVFTRFKGTIINRTFQMIILEHKFIAPAQLVSNQVEIQDQSLILIIIWLSLFQIASFLNGLFEHAKYILSHLHSSQLRMYQLLMPSSHMTDHTLIIHMSFYVGMYYIFQV